MLIFIAVALIVGFYVSVCLPLAIVARRTNDQAEYAFMAFIPIANLVLMCWIARVSAQLVWLVLAAVIPIFGQLVVIGLQCYLWIQIGRRFHRRWLSYLAAVLPFVGGWIFALSIKREAPAGLESAAPLAGMPIAEQ